jgi:hypothetical protein
MGKASFILVTTSSPVVVPFARSTWPSDEARAPCQRDVGNHSSFSSTTNKNRAPLIQSATKDVSTSRGTTLDPPTISHNTAISYRFRQTLDIVPWASSSPVGPPQHRNEIQRLLALDNLFDEDKSWLKDVMRQQSQKAALSPGDILSLEKRAPWTTTISP